MKNEKSYSKNLTFLLFLFILPLFIAQTKQLVFTQVIEFPKDRMINIPELKSKDNMFKEYCYIVEENYKLIKQNKPLNMLFFKYTVTDDSTLFEIASRCNITYDTIATINRIENITESLKNRTLILPTAPGLFIYKDESDNVMEVLLHEDFFNSIINTTPLYIIGKDHFFFLEDKKFSPTERSYFLDATLRLPIDRGKFWVSSDYGRRKQPFTGNWQNHNGIDLAANEGTPVHAIQDGVIQAAVTGDKTFGNYIIISHSGGKMTSVYAHLSKMIVTNSQKVKKGEIIGYVGHTGMATGSHLHFEIRQGGKPLDPESKMRIK